MRRARIAVGMFVVLSLSFAASNAQAGGLEYNGAGTRAAGRGGAFAARVDDPMALQLNPALLSDLTGVQLMLNLNVGLYNGCHQRAGRYGDAGRTDGEPTVFAPGWENSAFPEVCNETPFSPGASLAATFQLAKGFTLGVGVLTPYAAGATRYGGEDGTVANGTLPSPNRYNMVQQNLLQLFPSVGFGYRPTRWLAFGATLQWGITHISYTNYGAAIPSEEPAYDLRTTLEVSDNFTPAIIGSVALRPTPSLDFMLGVRYVDNVRARGTVTLDAHDFDEPTTRDATTVLENVRLVAPQTSAITFGVRYGHRRGSSTALNDATQQSLRGATFDRMNTEVFDVEFDAVYDFNNRVTDFVVSLPQGAVADVPAAFPESPLPNPLRLAHNWKNQISLRLGGDYNVIPGTLALRIGASFETSGVDPRYVQLDFIPGQRFSVSGGATLRLGRIDISLAYLHIFQADITSTATADVGLRQIALGTGNVINDGTYTARFDVFSLGANYHF